MPASTGELIPMRRGTHAVVGGRLREPASDIVILALRVVPVQAMLNAGTGLKRDAWEWTLTDTGKDGQLPSGRAIADQFGRHERWGRLVKRRGLEDRPKQAARPAAETGQLSKNPSPQGPV